MDALESAQCTDGSSRHIGELQIKLHDFIPSNFSRICHSERDIKGVSRVEWRIRQSQVAVAEARITQPISKWPQRLAFEVAIGAAFHRIVFKMRQLVDIF